MHNDFCYKHMPEKIYATPVKTWSWYPTVVDCSGNPTSNRKAHKRYAYVRADLSAKKTKLECFYEWKGDLPNKLIAIYSDGAGCGLFAKRGGLHYHADMVAGEDYEGVDLHWFIDSGYLWFIALPDNFKVWGEK